MIRNTGETLDPLVSAIPISSYQGKIRPDGLYRSQAGRPQTWGTGIPYLRAGTAGKKMNYRFWTGGRSVERQTMRGKGERRYWLGHSEAWLSVVRRGGGVVEARGSALLDSEPPSVPVDVVSGWLR